MELSGITLDRSRATDRRLRTILSGWYDPDSASFAGVVDAAPGELIADAPTDDADAAWFEPEGV